MSSATSARWSQVDSAESNELSCFGLNVLGHHLVETPKHRGHRDVDIEATMDTDQTPLKVLLSEVTVDPSCPDVHCDHVLRRQSKGFNVQSALHKNSCLFGNLIETIQLT